MKKRLNCLRITCLVILVMLVFIDRPVLTDVIPIDGTYKSIEENYEIRIILPTSHLQIRVTELELVISNNVYSNIVAFEVTELDLSVLLKSCTLLADQANEYSVTLTQIHKENSNDIMDFVFIFFFGLTMLLIVSIALMKKFRYSPE